MTSPALNTDRDYRERFVRVIATTCAANPGDRAALRSGLRRPPEDAPRMHRLVAPWLPDDPYRNRERALYTVASLIGAYDGPSVPGLSLGGALAGVRGIAEKTVADRLLLLARQDTDGVHRQIVGVVALIDAQKAPRPDWAQLVADLSGWPAEGRIAQRWLQQYHRAGSREATGTA